MLGQQISVDTWALLSAETRGKKSTDTRTVNEPAAGAENFSEMIILEKT